MSKQAIRVGLKSRYLSNSLQQICSKFFNRDVGTDSKMPVSWSACREPE